MQLKIIILLACLITTTLIAQDFNPKTITLSENPKQEEFSFLKEELKDVQIVQLGEITHFDGNVFEMKTKLVKFLIEEMGYTTLAFESGMYDVWKAQKKIKQGDNVKEALQNSLFSVWAKTNEFESCIQFIEKNKEQLKIMGFDNQITGTFGLEHLVPELYAYCTANNLKLKLKPDDVSLLLESMTKSGFFDEGDILFVQFNEDFNQLLTQLSKLPETEENFYWKQIVKGLIALGKDTFESDLILSTFNTTAADNSRDRQMAANLLAYSKRHPNEKIICWGANQHFVNDISSVKTPILKEFVPMGTYLKKELKEKIYSLAAVTATDSIFLQNKWNQTPIQPHSFEAFLKSKNVPHLFISSKQPEMAKTQFNRLFSPITFVEANLSQLHDGYLFFSNASQATPMTDENEITVSISKPADVEETINESVVISSLKEVIVYGSRTPYQIIKKAIEKQKDNYPDQPFSSQLYTNVSLKIKDSVFLDFDFVAEQYDLGYVSHTNRSTKKLHQIKWNKKSIYEPITLREYHGLMYNSPIQYMPLLKNNKFKKFDLVLEEVKMYEGEEVYVIYFSSSRNHSTFTRRVFLSNYSGYLYINKSDFAVRKLYENWEVTAFPESFQEGYAFSDAYAKYVKKEYTSESTLTEFKKRNGLYYITNSTNTIKGKIVEINSNAIPFETQVTSYWFDFNDTNPTKINNKAEQHLFEKVTFDPVFWKQFVKPE